MTNPAAGPIASGERAIGVGIQSGGINNTGDNPTFVHLDLGVLQSPDQVPPPDGLWNVPRRPSRVFVGRDKAMEDVAQALAAGTHGVIGQSVAGLGGVGKTEVALHHAHTCRERYTGVWWVSADTAANVAAGLAQLAYRLASATSALPNEQASAWATAWLHHHRGWLLILDNVEEPGDIEPLLAAVDGGHVLITTRRDIDWDSHGLVPIRLGILTEAEAVQMLYKRTGQHDETAAAAIAEYLGRLPLALEQAAAFINHHHISMASYRDQLDDQTGKLLASVAPGKDAERAVTRVWGITLNALTTTDPTAVEILRVLAWLGPDDVPRDLITALTDGDQTTADIALGLLASYSMITLDTYTVSTHRLLQTVLRLTPSADSSTTASSERAIQLLSDAIPDDPGGDPAGWPRWRDLLPHVTALGDFLPDSTDTTLGRLLNHAATFERRQGLHQQAELHDRQALSIAEAALGRDHPDVAICLNNLASSYFDLGRAAEAVPLLLRALEITEATLGRDHPDVAIRLNNLASTFFNLGRAADAVPLLLRALEITEATLGRDHPDVAIRLGNLANSYRSLGRAADSVPLEKRALTITATALGPNHPTVAVRLNNLAHSYRNLGRAADAVPLFLRALKITETALGLNHPDVAICLNNLASSYLDLGRAAEAVPLFQRALKITETALGLNHPDVAIRLSNLAASYAGLGRATDALALCRRAVQIADQTMPDGHPIAVSLHAFLKRLKQEEGRARRG